MVVIILGPGQQRSLSRCALVSKSLPRRYTNIYIHNTQYTMHNTHAITAIPGFCSRSFDTRTYSYTLLGKWHHPPPRPPAQKSWLHLNCLFRFVCFDLTDATDIRIKRFKLRCHISREPAARCTLL